MTEPLLNEKLLHFIKNMAGERGEGEGVGEYRVRERGVRLEEERRGDNVYCCFFMTLCRCVVWRMN